MKLSPKLSPTAHRPSFRTYALGMSILTTPAAAPAVGQIAEFSAGLAALEGATDQAEAIDFLAELEKLKSTAAAAQARVTAVLEKLRHEEEAARGVPKARRGKGLDGEIALARGESPARGTKSLNLAGALTTDLPHTMTALTNGRIREEHAQVVAQGTSWLSPEHRREVDALIAEQLGSLGPRQLGGEVRAHAQRLDQAGAVKRLAKARSERGVSVRPAPDEMAYVTALLPMQQAVAVLASLTRDATTMVGTGDTADPADPTDTPRTKAQIMADLFVERITGQPTAAAVPAEVSVIMTDAALFGEDTTPAWLAGHGPIPTKMAKQWLADPDATVYMRRIFTSPDDGQLVGLDSRSRFFPPGLRRMILLRDDICRTPWCDAKAQEADHMDAAKDGGRTSYDNASGLCVGCNQRKENNGWRHTGSPNRLNVITPTGHTYTRTSSPLLPGQPETRRRPPPRHLKKPGYDDHAEASEPSVNPGRIISRSSKPETGEPPPDWDLTGQDGYCLPRGPHISLRVA